MVRSRLGSRLMRPSLSSAVGLLDVFDEDGLRSYLMGFAEETPGKDRSALAPGSAERPRALGRVTDI